MIKQEDLGDLNKTFFLAYFLFYLMAFMFKYLSLPAFEGDRNLFLGTLMKLAPQK